MSSYDIWEDPFPEASSSKRSVCRVRSAHGVQGFARALSVVPRHTKNSPKFLPEQVKQSGKYHKGQGHEKFKP